MNLIECPTHTLTNAVCTCFVQIAPFVAQTFDDTAFLVQCSSSSWEVHTILVLAFTCADASVDGSGPANGKRL